MRVLATSYSGLYQVGQTHSFIRHKRDRGTGTRRGVILLPGGGGLDTSWQAAAASTTNPNFQNAAVNALVESGHRIVVPCTDWTYGNDTMSTRISDLWTYAAANHGFTATSDKIHLVTMSMGGLCALNWAKNNLTKVASIVGVIPVISPQDIDDNNRLVPYSLPAPSGAGGYGARPNDAHDPSKNASTFNGLAMKFYYSSTDTICIPSITTTFAASSGATAVSMGDADVGGLPGHGVKGLHGEEMSAFINSNNLA